MTTRRPIEFGVPFDLLSRQANRITVAGRCHRGPIHLGDLFDVVFHRDGTSQPVELRVVQLEAYRRTLDSIDEGLTASIVLEGSGVAHVTADTILHGLMD
jgi:hypothetical protein